MCELHETASPSVGRRTLLRGAGGLLIGGGLVAATATAQAATSQNGWSAGSSVVPLDPPSAPHLPGRRRGDVVLGYVARRFDREVEALVKGWCWGHSYRVISGSTSLSNHSSGTAIDLNAPAPPARQVGHLQRHAALAHPLDPELLQRSRALGRRLLGPQGRDALRDQRPSRAMPGSRPSPSASAAEVAARRRPLRSRGRRSSAARAASGSRRSSTCCASAATASRSTARSARRPRAVSSPSSAPRAWRPTAWSARRRGRHSS